MRVEDAEIIKLGKEESSDSMIVSEVTDSARSGVEWRTRF